MGNYEETSEFKKMKPFVLLSLVSGFKLTQTFDKDSDWPIWKMATRAEEFSDAITFDFESKMFGKGGKHPFSMEADYMRGGKPTHINLKCGDRVDQIQMMFGDTWGEIYGGNGGNFKSRAIPPEGIDGVIVRHGDEISQLVISFFNGDYITCGSEERKTELAISADPMGCPLAYMNGSVGTGGIIGHWEGIYSIQFIYKC